MELINTILTYLSPIVTAIVGWALGRRQKIAEAESSELANVKSALDIYNSMLADLKERMDALTRKCDSLAMENDQLRQQLISAQQDNARLRARMALLEAQLKSMH